MPSLLFLPFLNGHLLLLRRLPNKPWQKQKRKRRRKRGGVSVSPPFSPPSLGVSGRKSDFWPLPPFSLFLPLPAIEP